MHEVRPDTYDQFRRVREGFYGHLKATFVPVRPSVFGQPYLPPQFWIASGHRSNPDESHHQDRMLDGVVRQTLALKDASSRNVNQGVVQSAAVDRATADLQVFRRFVPDPGAPCYVIAPFRDQPADVQEDTVREFIYKMTKIEAEAADTLYDISTDADMINTRADSYRSVADSGSELWSNLSSYFPTARGWRLNRAHEQADLIHQVLLQGIAELQFLDSEVSELDERLAKASAKLVESFDSGFEEKPIEGRRHIRPSVRRGGYVANTRRYIKDAGERTHRAQESYKRLLQGVSQAFDERRVRLTDKVPVLALATAFALAVVPIFAEVWAAFLAGHEHGAWREAWVPILIAGLTLAGIAVVALIWYIFFRFGSLRVSRDFRSRYKKLHSFLSTCTSEILEAADRDSRTESAEFAWHPDRSARDTWSGYYSSWDAMDVKLSEECARQLDALRGVPKRRRRSKTRELERLRRRVEQWALVSIFATRRPRWFFGYPLPRLVLLYRAYPAWSLLDWRRMDKPSLVADSDLLLEMRVQCRAHPEEVEKVRQWTEKLADEADRERLPATVVLERITATGVRAGMRRSDWKEVFGRICADLPNEEPADAH